MENIASIWRRLLGIAIDLILFEVLSLGCVYIATLFGLTADSSILFKSSLVFVSLFLMLLYFIVLEATIGKTIGKYIAGTKVVNENGDKISWGQSVGRNLVRMFDSFLISPWLILIGLMAIILSKKRQRIGDMLVKTYIINENILSKNQKSEASELARPNILNIPLWLKVINFITLVIVLLTFLIFIAIIFMEGDLLYSSLLILFSLISFIYGVYFLNRNDKKDFSERILTSFYSVNLVFLSLVIFQLSLSFSMLGMGISIAVLSGAASGQGSLMIFPLAFVFFCCIIPNLLYFLFYYLIILNLQKKEKIIFYKFPHLLIWITMIGVPIIAFVISFFMILL